MTNVAIQASTPASPQAGLFAPEKNFLFSSKPKLFSIHPDKDPTYTHLLYYGSYTSILGVTYYHQPPEAMLVYTGRPYFAGATMQSKLMGGGCFNNENNTPLKKQADKALIESLFYSLYYDQQWLEKHPQYQKCHDRLQKDICAVQTLFVRNFGYEEILPLHDKLAAKMKCFNRT